MILIAAAIYLLIGLFLGGLWDAFDDGSGNIDIFMLITLLWPIVLFLLAIIAVVVMPYVVGKWIGEIIKSWL